MIDTTPDYQINVYAPIREFRAKVHITLNDERKTYDDDTIIRMNILEEMSTLNEWLPSNELRLTMDNSEGDFDLLSFENMHKILASKPKIETELGLVYMPLKASFPPFRYIRDWIKGNSVNNYSYWNAIKCFSGSIDRCQGLLPTSNVALTNASRVTDGDDSTYAHNITNVGKNYCQIDLGKVYWDIDKIQTIHYYVDKRTFYENDIEISEDGVNWIKVKDWTVVGTYPETKDGHIVLPNLEERIEWIPTGTFFLSEWKNDVTSKIVTMTANDYFAMFSDISYEPKGITNLKALAIDVLTVGGVPSEKMIIHDSLNNITVNSFHERISVRDALQHIGIASGSAVKQDRNGNIFIKPFTALDESSRYITYVSSQPSLFGYPRPTMYALNNTSGGMRYLDFDHMYNAPEVSLEKSVYQLVIKIYSNGANADPIEKVYTNTQIEGTNGLSFEINNPLLKTEQQADMVAKWYIRENNYNAIYRANWRQNPVLECADIILVEDSFNAEKQTRIIKQEINYEGYLQGITESRGGV